MSSFVPLSHFHRLLIAVIQMKRRNGSSVPAHYYDVGAYLHSEVREMGILYGIVLSILWRKEVLPR